MLRDIVASEANIHMRVSRPILLAICNEWVLLAEHEDG